MSDEGPLELTLMGMAHAGYLNLYGVFFLLFQKCVGRCRKPFSHATFN